LIPSARFFSVTKSNKLLIFGIDAADNDDDTTPLPPTLLPEAVSDGVDDAVNAADVTVVARDDGPGGNARLLSIRPDGAVPRVVILSTLWTPTPMK
jgi:hypothetical protein